MWSRRYSHLRFWRCRVGKVNGRLAIMLRSTKGNGFGVKRCLRDLQETCCPKGRKVPENVSEAGGMALELVVGGGLP